MVAHPEGGRATLPRGRAARYPAAMRVGPNDPCPCGSGSKYKRCCGPLHDGVPAPSPERLMRSRYAAYALGRTAYILDTTHPDSPHHEGDRAAWAASVAAFSARTRFVGLEVIEASERGDEGFVRFVARIEQDGRPGVIAENSRFLRVGGRWRYVADAG